jgi:SAM-dependent methyltransferase
MEMFSAVRKLNYPYEKYYNRIASEFNELRLDRYTEIVATGTIVRAFIEPEKGPLLDVGCGTGRYACYLSKLGFDVIGLDKSCAQLCQAPEITPRICACAMELPLRDETVWGMVIIDALHQFDSYTKALREAHRVIKPGGTLIIKTCSHEDLKKRPFGELFPSALAVNIERYPDISLLKNALTIAGFEMIKTIPTFTEQEMEVSTLLHNFRHQLNTTLDLIPKPEFREGCKVLENNLKGENVLSIPLYHTILIAGRHKAAFLL